MCRCIYGCLDELTPNQKKKKNNVKTFPINFE